MYGLSSIEGYRLDYHHTHLANSFFALFALRDTHCLASIEYLGNVQKVLVGREIASQPKVLMVAYPVRGLDINSSYTIYDLLTEQKEKGVAVVFVGEDLDVLIELCDRIMVINNGRVTGIVDGPSATKEEIGLMMTGNAEEV